MHSLSFITIGDELLRGRIVNTNASQVGAMLRQRGYQLSRVVTVSDEGPAIRAAIGQELASHDIVLMSGGLGPTRDDITKQVLADFFGGEWVWHAPTLDFLEERYRSRGRVLNELTRRQALVPSSCEVLLNPRGTAPGMLFRQEGKAVFSMPGVPFEMLHMMENEVLPWLERHFPPGKIASRVLRMTDMPESEAARLMEPLEQQKHPWISIAYLPRLDGLWIELSARIPPGMAETPADLLDPLAEEVRQLFERRIYATNDLPLAALLGSALQEQAASVAIAESLTGGRLAAAVVAISGASRYFAGSVTAYSPEIKTQLLQVPAEMIQTEGVESEAVARAMAAGVRKLMGTRIGIASTGLAEPSEGRLPFAWIGVADGEHRFAKRVDLFLDRANNLEYLVNYALQLTLRHLQGRIGADVEKTR